MTRAAHIVAAVEAHMRAREESRAIATLEAEADRCTDDEHAPRVTYENGCWTVEVGDHAVTMASLGGALIEAAGRCRS